MNHLISYYPVTRSYLNCLAEKTGRPLKSVVVSAITPYGYLGIFRYFRRLESETVYLPVLDPSGRPLLPPLQILSILIRAREHLIVESDFSTHAFGFTDVFLGGLRMLWGIVDGLMIATADWQHLSRLLKAERMKSRDNRIDCVVYLKTNLWLGIQAGGSVAHTSGVIKGLLDKGFRVEFASVETPVAMKESEALKFNPITPHGTYVIPRELNHFRHNGRFIDGALRLFRKTQGFIYQRLSLGNYAGVILSRRYGVPLVLEYNGSENWLANNWGTPLTLKKLVLRSENVCLKHAHLVVTVSDVLRDELIERGVDRNRVVSTPNGVDTNLFNSDRFSKKAIIKLRESYGIHKDSLVITFVGTFGPWHGAEVFAEFLTELGRKDSAFLEEHRLQFMFIGDGIKRPDVEKITGDPDINKYVTIAGLIDQEETPVHLAASDILVSPHVPNPDGSPFFGSPTKLFEYLSSGRPVIGSDLFQIGEVLEDCPHVMDISSAGEFPLNGACGIRVTPQDTLELAIAIKFLVKNPDWRKTAGRNARRLALERYTWDRHVGAILKGLQTAHALDAVQDRPKIRLLFNALHSKSGGGLTYLRNILPYFATDIDLDIHLCVHDDQKGFLPDTLDNITVHYLDFPQGFWRLQVREQTDVPKLARRIGADVTFSPANYGPLMAPNTVILLRNALSVAIVERRPVKLAYWAMVYAGTLLSLLAAKRVITVSEYARDAASGGLTGLFSKRIRVIPHGVSEIFLPPIKNAKREKFLLAVSDIYVQKNFKNLIIALARIAPDHSDVILKIAGQPVDTEYFAELKIMVSKEKLDGKVEFLGQVHPQELVALYQRCGVFIFPSTVETFGNPLVEAMACGAPIACSNTAAMPEVVGDAAVFFDPLNIESMASVISRFLNDAQLCRDFSRKAVERARQYSWKKTADQTLAIIKDVNKGNDLL
jgi:glycosyltransferase involved in cell wall biosynthesis